MERYQSIHMRSNRAAGLSRVAVVLIGLIISSTMVLAILATRAVIASGAPTLDRANRLLEKGKYREALALTRSVAPSQRNRDGILVAQGKAWLSLALKREQEEGWRQYGTDNRDWLPTQEAQRAYACFEKALAINPDNISARFMLGMVCLEKGWLRRAGMRLSEVIDRQPGHVDALINRAVVYTKINRYPRAEDDLKAAWRADSGNPTVAKNISFLYRYYLGKPDSAMVWANRYLNLQPRGDRDRFVVRRDLEELLQRYPEVQLPDSQNWRRQRRFKPRFSSKDKADQK